MSSLFIYSMAVSVLSIIVAACYGFKNRKLREENDALCSLLEKPKHQRRKLYQVFDLKRWNDQNFFNDVLTNMQRDGWIFSGVQDKFVIMFKFEDPEKGKDDKTKILLQENKNKDAMIKRMMNVLDIVQNDLRSYANSMDMIVQHSKKGDIAVEIRKEIVYHAEKMKAKVNNGDYWGMVRTKEEEKC